jgi:transcriptional regulator with XRE-family HTH domain
MAKEIKTKTVFSVRLKQARLRAGFTQIELGVLAGIEEFSASARINQYERATHAPNYGTAERLSVALNVPISFLFESDDKLASIILIAGQLTAKNQDKLLAAAEAMI